LYDDSKQFGKKKTTDLILVRGGHVRLVIASVSSRRFFSLSLPPHSTFIQKSARHAKRSPTRKSVMAVWCAVQGGRNVCSLDDSLRTVHSQNAELNYDKISRERVPRWLAVVCDFIHFNHETSVTICHTTRCGTPQDINFLHFRILTFLVLHAFSGGALSTF
jgi:hypothetical protein